MLRHEFFEVGEGKKTLPLHQFDVGNVMILGIPAVVAGSQKHGFLKISDPQKNTDNFEAFTQKLKTYSA